MPKSEAGPRKMHNNEKQRVRAKNKRAPTLIEKARELLRLSGVKTTLIINEDPVLFSHGKVHMYTNEDRPMIEVLEGYVRHIKTKRPYYLVNHDAPDATFLKKHTKKRKFSLHRAAVPTVHKSSPEKQSILVHNNTDKEISDTMEDDDGILDDLSENTEIYKKGPKHVYPGVGGPTNLTNLDAPTATCAGKKRPGDDEVDILVPSL